jgi:hypothetical protein
LETNQNFKIANAAANQPQQLKNEATKMAMREPLFYGNEKEDTVNIKDFIARFESACTAMGLVNKEEKCNLFGSYLRGKATASLSTTGEA